MNLIQASCLYVFSDPFFWPSMAFTAIVGIFIGAVIHNGNMADVKKTLISLASYVLLIVSVDLSRILPEISVVNSPYKPIAQLVTIAIVTVFYLMGLLLGVFLVKKARRKQ